MHCIDTSVGDVSHVLLYLHTSVHKKIRERHVDMFVANYSISILI